MKPQNKEQQILAAAEEEFFSVGYDRAKTTSIAARAGVTHAMLHYYFRTKENLFNKVFESKIDLLYQLITSIFVKNDIPLMDKIEAGIRAHFQLLIDNPGLPQFAIAEIISKKERLEAYKKKLKPMVDLVVPAVQAEFDRLYEKGEIAKVAALDILQNMILLDVSAFLFDPMLNGLTYDSDMREEFLNHRLEENILLIKNRIKYGVK